MVILHLIWKNRKLVLWGERELSDRNAWTKDPHPLSPFSVGSVNLRQSAAYVLKETDPCEWAEERIDLTLPTEKDGKQQRPIPSQAFLSQKTKGQTPGKTITHCYKWQVDALVFSWKTAICFLGQIKERRLGDELFAAEDVLRFAELFRYAGALVARGAFVPSLVFSISGDGEARWRPIFAYADQERLKKLISRLPPIALNSQPAQEIVESFLNEMVDRLVRVSVVTTLSRAQAEHGKHYSVHDAWFSALRGEQPRVQWQAVDEIKTLNEQLSAWCRPIDGGTASDETLIFCLEEPPQAAQVWFLRVKVIRNKQIFDFSVKNEGDNKPCFSESRLLSLGQAAQLFYPLDKADVCSEGYGCFLTLREAHTFLAKSSAVLIAAGFQVQVPCWWRRDDTRVLTLKAEAAVRQPSNGNEQNLNEKVDVRWSVCLNGEPITQEELSALLKAQSSLVYFRGQWMQIDVRQIQEALRIEQRKNDEVHPALDVVRWALGLSDRRDGLGVSVVRSDGWMDGLLKRLNGDRTIETLPAPQTFCGTLRPYQIRGYSWLVYLRSWGLGACLADDMGLGKTIQALAFLLYEKGKGEKRPVLLVGPMSVLGNWLHEAQRFAPNLRCLLHHGPSRPHGKSFVCEARSADLVVTSYHLLYRDYTDLRAVEWAGILLDEAQNIKNPETRQAQAARALSADYRIALTGTPMENHVGDIWSIMDFLNPGLLGRRSAFRENFYRPIQTGTDCGARARLRRVTQPFILRRLKTDRQIIADLPEKIESKVYCPLTLEQAKLYRSVLDAFHRDLEQSEGLERRGLILAVLTHLKQVCDHPAHYLRESQAQPRRSGKLARLEDMLCEVFERGESALIFTQYAEMGALLKKRLCRAFACEVPFLHGGVPRKERDRLVEAFQTSTQPQAFVLSLKAGGTGLNLTRATHVFHYDRWWNPAVENQATDRAFRIGQTHNVMVHKFICSGTLEERIDAMIENKMQLADEIVTSGEAFLTELSDEALRDVLKLSEAAVIDEEETT